VLYPGSIERTSFAEKDEPKGLMHLTVAGGRLDWNFVRLYARPMVSYELDVTRIRPAAVDASIRAMLRAAPRDAVLRIRVDGTPGDGVWRMLSAPRIRSIAPPTMTVEIRAGDSSVFSRRPPGPHAPGRAASASPTMPSSPQLDLGVFGM
jgi:DNA repair exonuclease SbcCD nuclease subunit